MTVSALLLDLDGTLVDSEPMHRAGYPAFFDARGREEPDLSLFTARRAEDVFATKPGPWAGAELGVLAAEVGALIDPGVRPGGRDHGRQRACSRDTECLHNTTGGSKL